MLVRDRICTIIALLFVVACFCPVRGQADLDLIGLSYGARIEFFQPQASGSNPFATQTWDGGGVTNNWSEAANWTNDQLPTTAVFDGTSTKNAIIDISLNISGIQILSGYTGTITMAPAVNVTFGDSTPSTQASGTFNASNGTLTFGNPATGGGFNLSGGTFNAGSAQMSIRSVFNQTGGAFNAGSANITVGYPGFNAGSFNAQDSTIQVWGDLNFAPSVFNSAGGNSTVVLYSTNRSLTMTGSEVEFKNLTISKDEGHRIVISDSNRTVRVTGILDLTEGGINATGSNSVVKAEGPVNIGATFGNADDGNPNNGVGGNGTVLIKDGPAGRAINWPATASLPHIRLDDPNVTLTVTGTALARSGAIALTNGTIEAPTASLKVGHGASTSNSLDQSNGLFHVGSGDFNLLTGSFRLTGGTFTMDTGNATFPCFLSFNILGGTFNASSGTTTICSGNVNGQYTQSGGVVNAGAGTFAVGYQFNLNSGTFNASSGITRFGFSFVHAGGTFTHGGGTAVFQSTQGAFLTALAAGTQFNNLNLAPVGDSNVAVSGTPIVNGDLNLINGFANGSAIQVKGNVIVNTTADGGTAPITFNGTGPQTFTNNGGPNTTGAWTVNKTGGILTAATDMILGTGQALNITTGTLYLADGSDLTAGAITIGANGKLASDSTTTITLGANAVNNGRLDLQGGGATCPEADTILLRSSVAGVRRNWSGTGLHRISDVDVRDMGGTNATTPAITVFSGTDSGNNNTNWTFNPGCAPELTISPLSANVSIGGTQQFTGGGGFGTRTFSIATNNSGSSINATTGFYTAGMTSGVTDTVRVTDSFGTTADATVNVIGTATRVAFIVQPSNAVAGQTITPSIQVAVQDVAGNTVTNAANSITLAIFDNPGSGVLSGTVTRNAVMGIATFDNLSINRAASGYTLQATSTGLTSATSSTFNISAGAPAKLGFVTEPSNTNINSPIVPPIQIAIQDAVGNTVPTATNFVSLLLENNPGSATMSGTPIRQAVSGVATFDDISLNRVADGYSLRAQAAPLTDAVSVPFNITRPIFVVTNVNADGPGSYRQALLNANALPGSDTINFNIAGTPPYTIAPTSPLPATTEPIVIDATTQPGYSGSPIIRLDGDAITGTSVRGVELRGGNSTVKGLAITRFDVGIILSANGGNTIQGNYIGTDVTGTMALGNGTGIRVGSSNNFIGGTTPAARNLISGNTLHGIYVVNVHGILIRGNFIGTNVSGNSPLPNGGDGIVMYANYSTVGGDQVGESNVIAFNSKAGVRVDSTATPSIRTNSIHSNSGIGIDLHNIGVTLNSFAPPYVVPPANFPELYNVTTNGSTTTIRGLLASIPDSSFTIDFFSQPACDATAFGEGRVYLGSTVVSTAYEGLVGFTRTLPVATTVGHVVTATATGVKGTSEFARCLAVAQSVVSISGRAADGNGVSLPNTLVQLSGARTASTLTNANGEYSFGDLPGGLNYTVSVSRANYSFSPPSRSYTAIGTDQTNQNFTGTRTRFSISGNLTRPIGTTGISFPLSTVTMTLSGPVARSLTANYSYAFNDLPAGNYVLSPSKEGFTFNPPSVNISLGGVDHLASFAGTPSVELDGRVIFNSSNSLGSLNANGDAYHPSFASPTYAPAPSQDGKKLIYYKTVGSSTGLYTSNSDGSDEVRVADFGVSHPSWSPDGSKIAFTVQLSGRWELHTVNADGSGRVQVPTGAVQYPGYPTWLSNTRLAFSASDIGGDREIYAVNTDGSGAAQLTNNTFLETFPRASPDGTRIAFARSGPGSVMTYPYRLMVMNADGTNQTELSALGVSTIAWSPDNLRIAFVERGTPDKLVAVNSTDGSGRRVIMSRTLLNIWWVPEYAFSTPTGSNVVVNAGGARVTFAGVAAAGMTTFTPLSPTSLGGVPAGYVLSGNAYEISTTAPYVSPVTVCLKVPATTAPTQTAFDSLGVMHSEGGILVDRTSNRNFAQRTVCSQTPTLSTFVLAEHANAPSPDNGTPLPSITGLIVDTSGNPMPEVQVQLGGAELRSTHTDQNGNFSFVNLTQGGSFTVQPRQPGYIFDERIATFLNLSGAKALAFTGAAAQFSISGRVVDVNGGGIGGVTVSLEGDRTESTVTNMSGDYAFSSLPADGSYMVQPLGSGVFDPGSSLVDSLTSNITGLDFTQYPNAPAFASIGGRTVTVDGEAISRTFVSVVDSQGQILQTTMSNPFGFYVLSNVPTGQTYTLLVGRKGYEFAGSPMGIFVTGDVPGLDFVASP